MFDPSRAAGLALLDRFIPRAGQHYAEQRNYDHGPLARDNISMLSPYLRHRLLSEGEVIRATLNVHSAKQAEKFVQEVFWRTYWKGWLEQRPSVWTRYCAELDSLDNRENAELDAAIAARTGIDCFDHWMRELVDTGYLHNHARMWFASIWIFTLRLPWQQGAALFMKHLFDGDPASNTLSWRWVAGLQTEGKHYGADAENIHRFTGGRFAPSGLSKTTAPLPMVAHPEPRPVKALAPVASGPVILLITEEDMIPELNAAMAGKIKAVMIGPLAQQASPSVNAFREAALKNSGEEVSAKLSVPMLQPSGWSPGQWAEVSGSFSGLPLVTAYPPTGPVQSALQMIENGLTGAGHELQYFRRKWDDLCWPHARKGFFPFKENIPTILHSAGLTRSGSGRRQIPDKTD